MVNVAKQSSPALPLLTCGELAVSKGLTKMSKQQRQGCVCVRPFVGKKKRTIMCHFVLKTEKTWFFADVEKRCHIWTSICL